MDIYVAICSLFISIIALGLSVYFWKRSFRPIITVMVKTYSGGNELIAYNLEILNSGTLPAKNIALTALDASIENALGKDSNDKNKHRWLSCFEPDNIILILQNNEKIKCSFGTTKKNDEGFWKYKSKIKIAITYEGWFGKRYNEDQEIQIIDSESFTGHFWK